MEISSRKAFSIFVFIAGILLSFSSGDDLAIDLFPTTNSSVQPAPKNLKVTHYQADSLTLSWDEPPEWNGTGLGYIISLDGHSVRLNGIERRHFKFTSLKSSTSYIISLTALCQVDDQQMESDPTTLKATTDFFNEPSPPRNFLVVSQQPDVVTVVWDPPLHWNAEDGGYLIGLVQDEPKTRLGKNVNTFKSIGMKMGTPYILELVAYNRVDGKEKQSHAVRVQVLTKPSMPRNLTQVSAGSRRIDLFWDGPVHEAVDGYYVYSVNADTVGEIWLPGKTSTPVMYLKPWTYCFVSVASYVEVEGVRVLSDNLTATFKTEYEAPSRPESLTVANVTDSEVLVKWEAPVAHNGPLTGYILTWTTGKETYNIVTKKTSKIISDLRPWTSYDVNVRAYNDPEHQGKRMGLSRTASVRTSATAPPSPSKNITLVNTKAKSTTVDIPLDIFSTQNGPIVEYMLLVAFNSSEDFNPRRGFDGPNKTHFPSWEEAKNTGFWYRSTPDNWDLTTDKETCSDAGKGERKCEIGHQQSCNSVQFCNGPLNAKTKYWVKLRAYTENGWSETYPVSFETANASFKPTGGIFLLIAISFLKFWM